MRQNLPLLLNLGGGGGCKKYYGDVIKKSKG